MATYKVINGPALLEYYTITEVAEAETEAGGVKFTAAQLGLQNISFGWGFIVGTTEEGTTGVKTSFPGYLNPASGGATAKLTFYDTATGKEIVTGKAINKATLRVVAFGEARA